MGACCSGAAPAPAPASNIYHQGWLSMAPPMKRVNDQPAKAWKRYWLVLDAKTRQLAFYTDASLRHGQGGIDLHRSVCRGGDADGGRV